MEVEYQPVFLMKKTKELRQRGKISYILYSFPLNSVLFTLPMTFYNFLCILRSGFLCLCSPGLARHRYFPFFFPYPYSSLLCFSCLSSDFPDNMLIFISVHFCDFFQQSKTLHKYNILKKSRNTYVCILIEIT